MITESVEWFNRVVLPLASHANDYLLTHQLASIAAGFVPFLIRDFARLVFRRRS